MATKFTDSPVPVPDIAPRRASALATADLLRVDDALDALAEALLVAWLREATAPGSGAAFARPNLSLSRWQPKAEDD
jgi:hypothetical protein